ncbi:MAG TPA: hypothetical protein VNS61_08825 [Caldimonas sp.]|nr:hypothetical protein [Caldimonas sp.]
MNKLLRNLLIAAGVAVAVGFVFGFLGAVLHSEEVGSSGQFLAGTLGILTFFILHLRAGNRRAVPADTEARARALSFACPPNQALVYFIRTGFAGKAVGVDLAIDGKTVAQIKSPRFTCVTVPPGPHELRAHVGDGTSALSPAEARLTNTLTAGSITLLHIGIERGMVKSKLVFEPWALDAAKSRLGKIGMELPAIQGLLAP